MNLACVDLGGALEWLSGKSLYESLVISVYVVFSIFFFFAVIDVN